MQACHFNFLICRFELFCRIVITQDCNQSSLPQVRLRTPWATEQTFRLRKRSGYCRNLGSLRAGTRHHGEFSVMGTPSLQPFLNTYWLTPVNDWPIVAKHANMTSSRGSINAAPATITSESDTERRLAERAAITAITVMSRSRSQGTEVTTVTGAFPFELSRDITENSPLWERYSIPPW